MHNSFERLSSKEHKSTGYLWKIHSGPQECQNINRRVQFNPTLLKHDQQPSKHLNSQYHLISMTHLVHLRLVFPMMSQPSWCTSCCYPLNHLTLECWHSLDHYSSTFNSISVNQLILTWGKAALCRIVNSQNRFSLGQNTLEKRYVP